MSGWKTALEEEWKQAEAEYAELWPRLKILREAAKAAGLTPRREYTRSKHSHAAKLLEFLQGRDAVTVEEIREAFPENKHVSGTIDLLKRQGAVSHEGFGLWKAVQS